MTQTRRPRPADTVVDPKIDSQLDRLSAQRERLVTRHSHRLRDLMEAREDLRGVHAMADFVDDAVRWSA
ncbi:hypothetical protein [Nocardioides sp. CFH 31398]|uniref:hypothetical protein n=1 Tax=Nocardioides sp. CFH 31398 TaxID=2919579 RepID=UPI001F0568B7|nr:hypothetical protein [Nocardioides sp. CFH 31398]MCH1869070.1 hypothetical protein [Nocardioides sp. CFH 31398]